ncbi:MAG: hypothetical protein Q9164_000372 [Protoblastenia rupestris]
MSTSIAFFGATGGSTVACLAFALEAGYTCSALSRSSSKLHNLLLDRKIPESTINAHLTIIQGDVRDPQSVSQTLAPPTKIQNPNSTTKNPIVDLIISGIGRPPIFTPNPLNPTFDDPTICQDAIGTILAALRNNLQQQHQPSSSSPPLRKKPLLVALSTTGISAQARDVPLAMIPLYHWVLAVPHKDKKEMEALLVAEAAKPPHERVIEDFVIVRPSLLTDKARLGTGRVRVGEPKEPAVGYTISREDVGGWVFDEIVNNEDGREKFAGHMVSITY